MWQARSIQTNCSDKLSKPLYSEVKLKVTSRIILIPHCTGKLCVHNYGKHSRSKLNLCLCFLLQISLTKTCTIVFLGPLNFFLVVSLYPQISAIKYDVIIIDRSDCQNYKNVTESFFEDLKSSFQSNLSIHPPGCTCNWLSVVDSAFTTWTAVKQTRQYHFIILYFRRPNYHHAGVSSRKSPSVLPSVCH